jgi:hypothetical protein
LNLDELLHEREWRRCAPDWDTSTDEQKLQGFIYFCSNYAHIRHPERGRIKFDLRPAQIETIEAWLCERQTVVLKARQIGFSTLVSIYCFWLTYFYEDRAVIMLSKTERDAALLLQHANYSYRFMPDWLKLIGPVVSRTQTKLSMSNESYVESLPSASDPARGRTAFLIVVDEIGQLPNSDEAWAAIEPVADVGGRIILLGTANGEGNLFHRMWVGAQNGTNRFKGVFFPWSASERDDAWYEAKKQELPAWQLAQEYPSNPDEAFLRSGRPLFDIDRLREIEVEEGVQGYLDDMSGKVVFYEGGGPLTVWATPKDNHVYVVGADVAEGLDHGDYSTAHVIDARTGEVVAHWHGHIDPDLFGERELFMLGRWYNGALVGVESNNHGLTTLRALLRTKYRNIYRQRRLDKRNAKATESLGWRTTSASKPLAIDELGKTIREQSLGLLCARTIAELRTYVREGNGKMHGSPHDDRVMSLAIAVQMLKFVWLPEFRPVKPKPQRGTWGHLLGEVYRADDDEDTSSRPLGWFGVRDRPRSAA